MGGHAGTSFRYRALTAQGSETKGEVVAESERHAYQKLIDRGLSPYKILRVSTPTKGRFSGKNRVNQKTLSRFLRQLATLVGRKVPLIDALTSLATSKANVAISARCETVLSDLRAGKIFSESVSERFPELPGYVGQLSQLGEKTGQLGDALSDAADRMDREQAIKAEVRSALTYPTFLFGTGAVVVILMFYFVVPRFASLVGDDLSKVPAISRSVLGIGTFLNENLLTIVGVVGGLGLLAVYISGTASGTDGLARLARSAPLIGPFLKKSEIAQWLQTMGVAIKNKAHLTVALSLGQSAVKSEQLKAQLELVNRDVRGGEAIDVAIASHVEGFEPFLLDLIRTGRTSGSLDVMLLYGASEYEKSLQETTKRITALVEPIAIIVISLLVGSIVVSIMLAMTSLYDIAG
ncbi:MAG: type II secretion system F family protein [Pseudomonadota bacterium]